MQSHKKGYYVFIRMGDCVASGRKVFQFNSFAQIIFNKVFGPFLSGLSLLDVRFFLNLCCPGSTSFIASIFKATQLSIFWICFYCCLFLSILTERIINVQNCKAALLMPTELNEEIFYVKNRHLNKWDAMRLPILWGAVKTEYILACLGSCSFLYWVAMFWSFDPLICKKYRYGNI